MDLLNSITDDDVCAPYESGLEKSIAVESDLVPVQICFFNDNLK